MITVTEKAVDAVRQYMKAQNVPDGAVLRVAIAAGGCSGFSYQLGFDEKFDPAKDHVYVQHDLKVVVDKKSSLYLDGTTIDHYSSIEKSGFTFDNPNVVKSCGCGSSFSA